MRTTVEYAGHAITLDNRDYSRRDPKPADLVEVPEWDDTGGQRLEFAPPLALNESTVEVLGGMAADRGIELVDFRQVPPSDTLPEGSTILLVDPDRFGLDPASTLIYFGRKVAHEFGGQAPRAGV